MLENHIVFEKVKKLSSKNLLETVEFFFYFWLTLEGKFPNNISISIDESKSGVINNRFISSTVRIRCSEFHDWSYRTKTLPSLKKRIRILSETYADVKKIQSLVMCDLKYTSISTPSAGRPIEVSDFWWNITVSTKVE